MSGFLFADDIRNDLLVMAFRVFHHVKEEIPLDSWLGEFNTFIQQRR